MAAASPVLTSWPAEDEETELRKIFDELDEDSSGELDRDEVRSLVTQLGMDASEKDVDAAMAAMDKDGDGTVDFPEFCLWWRSRPSGSDTIVSRLADRMSSLKGGDPVLETHVLYAFELIDEDGSGRLDEEEVALAAKRLGADMAPEDAAGMFGEMEKGPSGEVGFHAFRRWYLKAMEDGRVPKPDAPPPQASGTGAGAGLDRTESGGKQLWGQAKTKLNALMMFKNAFNESVSSMSFSEMTPQQWAEWVAQAMWWERMHAGHAPKPHHRRRPAQPPVHGAAFRLERPLPPAGKETRGIGVGKHAARVLEGRKYDNGVTSDWPSAGTQLPGRPSGYVPKPEPPPSPPTKPGSRVSSAFRRQMLQRRAAATGRARLGAGKDSAKLARRVGLHSPRSARLVAPQDVPRVNFIRTQRAHHEMGTAVAEAAWEKAGQRGVAQVLAEVIEMTGNRPSTSDHRSPRRPGSGVFQLDEHEELQMQRPASGSPEGSSPKGRPGSRASPSKPPSALVAGIKRRDVGQLGAAMLPVDYTDDAGVSGHTGRWQPLTWSVRPPASDYVVVNPHDPDYDKARVVMSTENGKNLSVSWRERYPYRKIDKPVVYPSSNSTTWSAVQSSKAPASGGGMLDSNPSWASGIGGSAAGSSGGGSAGGHSSGGSTFRRERAMAYNTDPAAATEKEGSLPFVTKGSFSESNSFQSVNEWDAKNEASLPFSA
jgi:Ca2+-binding EF-hand superfamily protein